LAPGHRADLALWDIAGPAELAYAFGANPLVARVARGIADARQAQSN
jgi:imidazolonepropionase